jgi:hypothetical protein
VCGLGGERDRDRDRDRQAERETETERERERETETERETERESEREKERKRGHVARDSGTWGANTPEYPKPDARNQTLASHIRTRDKIARYLLPGVLPLRVPQPLDLIFVSLPHQSIEVEPSIILFHPPTARNRRGKKK